MLVALLFAFLASFATPASARTHPGTHLTGTILKVDAGMQEVEMQGEDNGTLIKFTWSSRTAFFANGQAADAAIVKKGARVDVIYHMPFFGKPWVAKIVVLPKQ